jgi:signal transduction histidine kinase
VPDGRSPLWRAFNVFRIVAFLYATCWFAIQVPGYAHPVLGSVVIAVMGGWTAFTVWKYRYRAGRTSPLVFADQVMVSALYLTGGLALSHSQIAHGLPSVVSVWVSTMALSAGLRWGMVGGAVSGLLAASYNFPVRGFAATSTTFTNMMLLIGAGVLVGLASETARRSTERLAWALRAESATIERERLARSIHDNVLQVLARVRQRGNELGGEAAELAQLAGEQEIALRTLMTEPAPPSEDGSTDLATRLVSLRTAKVEISVPAVSVSLPEPVAADLAAVVRETLENVGRHAGPNAKAWVLLEDLGDEIVISVRDDGAGIPEGRLEQAASEGRMGVAQSVRGRVHHLGGTLALDTAPGAGTEWEIRVPRRATEKRRGRFKGARR